MVIHRWTTIRISIGSLRRIPVLRNTSRSGQGIVEFALAIPVFLAMILGVIEGGRLLFLYSAVTSAAREAARWGAVADHFNDCSGIVAAASRIGSIAGVEAGDITIGYDNGPGTTLDAGCPPPSSVTLGDRIVITVTKDYSPIVPLVNFAEVPIAAESARTIIHELYLTEEPDEDETEETEPPEEEDIKLKLVGLAISTSGDMSKCKDWNTHVNAIVQDENGTFIDGAVVTGNWTDVVTAGDTCTTGVGGICTDLGISSISKKGTAVFTVNTIGKSGYVYDSSLNTAPTTVSVTCK